MIHRMSSPRSMKVIADPRLFQKYSHQALVSNLIDGNLSDENSMKSTWGRPSFFHVSKDLVQ